MVCQLTTQSSSPSILLGAKNWKPSDSERNSYPPTRVYLFLRPTSIFQGSLCMEVLTFQSNAILRFGNGGEWHLPSVKQDRGHYERGVGKEAGDHLNHRGPPPAQQLSYIFMVLKWMTLKLSILTPHLQRPIFSCVAPEWGTGQGAEP